MENSPTSNRSLLIILTIGVWIMVFQNIGIIPVFFPHTVKVAGVTDVKGKLEVVNGSAHLKVDLTAINGNTNAFYMDDDGEYIVLPIIDKRKDMYVTD